MKEIRVPEEEQVELKECQVCGMPTVLEVCAVCRMKGVTVPLNPSDQ